MNYTKGVAWRPEGFQVEVQRVSGTRDRFLKVSDLNPEAHIYQRLTRGECARIGLLLVWRSVFARTPAEEALRR
jgi:hypothetical protein